MLSDEVIDKVIERLVNRIENVNIYVLKQIGKTIKKMGTLAPSDTDKLIQIMNYGGDYKKIVKELSKVTKLNQKEIYQIFEEVAKSDLQFAKKFYKYRNKKFIPYAFNKQLQEQVQAIARATAETYVNISKTLAFSKKVKGKVVYNSIGETYQNVIDEGLIAMSQSKDTFNQVMRKAIRELASSGIRSVDWESGISRSLEYAVRMNLRDGIRTLHNETQQIIADDIKADGIEISVHSNPAPDHQEAQGRQFSLKEFNKLQETGYAKDYTNKEINLHRHLIRTDKYAESFRPISKMNCYHYEFSIILGVNKPQYTDEQLQGIIDRNNKGFDYEGKHYSMYEGTQLQRKIENAIRKEKNVQIMAKESGQDDLVQESQKKINELVNEYHKVSKISGLSTKLERMQVDGYKEVEIKEASDPEPEKKIIEKKPKKVSKEETNGSYDFSRFREDIDSIKSESFSEIHNTIREEFDVKGFFTEYNKFYDTLDEEELKKLDSDFRKWTRADPAKRGGQPIGEFLFKKFNYDEKPELISYKEFWKDKNGKPVKEYDNNLLDENHWFRGILATEYSDVLKQRVPDRKTTKQFADEFKKGPYFSGIGVAGNGTYASRSYQVASRYCSDVEEGLMYIIPKDNIKTVWDDNISTLAGYLCHQLNDDNIYAGATRERDKVYLNLTGYILRDPGYLATILGYDVIDLGVNKVILNRGAIKVVE